MTIIFKKYFPYFHRLIIILFVCTAFMDIGLGYKSKYAFTYLLPYFAVTFFLRFFYFEPLGSWPNWKKYLQENSKMFWPFLLMTAWYIISLSWAPNSFDAYYTLKRYLIGFFLIIFGVLYLKKNETDILLAQKTLASIWISHLFICFLEMLAWFRWPLSPISSYLKYFGRKFNPTNSLLRQPEGVADTYPISFTSHPNDAALLTLLGLPLLLSSNINYRWKIAGAIFFMVQCFYGGAKGILMIGLSYLLFYFIFIQTKIKKNQISWKLKLGFVFGVLFAASYLLTNLNYERKNEMKETLKVVSSYLYHAPKIVLLSIQNKSIDEELKFVPFQIHERLAFIDGGLKTFLKNPFRGVGIGGLRNETHLVLGHPVTLRGIHFYFIEALAMGGVFFIIIYLWWYWRIISNLNKQKMVLTEASIFSRKALTHSLILFAIASPVLSQALMFLPKNLLYLFCILAI